MDADIISVVKRASRANTQACAPDSKFAVGAALLADFGGVFTGCNFDNVSLGLAICAERSCVSSAVAASEKKRITLAIVVVGLDPIVPCGKCRQVLAEFNPALAIIRRSLAGQYPAFDSNELLPLPRQGIPK